MENKEIPLRVVTSLDEYQALALRTQKHDEPLTEILHYTLGLVGEVAELMEVQATEKAKRIKEAGDCMWYSAVMADKLGLRFSALEAFANDIPLSTLIRTPHEEMVIASGRMADMVKKSVFYGKELDRSAMVGDLGHYVKYLFRFIERIGEDPLNVGTLNIRKLEARFPELAFNADHAINRDHEAEAKAAGL